MKIISILNNKHNIKKLSIFFALFLVSLVVIIFFSTRGVSAADNAECSVDSETVKEKQTLQTVLEARDALTRIAKYCSDKWCNVTSDHFAEDAKIIYELRSKIYNNLVEEKKIQKCGNKKGAKQSSEQTCKSAKDAESTCSAQKAELQKVIDRHNKENKEYLDVVCNPSNLTPKGNSILDDVIASTKKKDCESAKKLVLKDESSHKSMLAFQEEECMKTNTIECPLEKPKEESKKDPFKCSEPGSFKIMNYEPKEVFAGKYVDLDSDLWARYKPLDQEVKIKSDCLEGLTIMSSSRGVDGNPTVQVRKELTALPDTKEASFVMSVSPYAKEGKGAITLVLQNKLGEKQEISFDVKLSGDQYLNRIFSNATFKTNFYGHWPEINDQVLAIKSKTEEAFNKLNKLSYRSLGLIVKLYEPQEAWRQQLAKMKKGSNLKPGERIEGFIGLGSIMSRGSTNILYMGAYEDTELSRPFIHESTHALHYCYTGASSFASICTGNNFENEWQKIVDASDPPSCKYLPLKQATQWKDGSREPRCGYVKPFGAYYASGLSFMASLAKLKTANSEDVATFNEIRVFSPDKIMTRGDATDPKYQQIYKDKNNLLEQYGF